MTDARLPERWLMDRRLQKLQPADYVSFVNALLWCVMNRTDGHVEATDLALIPRFRKGAEVVMVDAGLWVSGHDSWQVADFVETQTSKSELEVLERARRADREKKARQRASLRGAGPGDSPGDVSRGHEGGQDRQAGRQGLGEEETGESWHENGRQPGDVFEDDDGRWKRVTETGEVVPADSWRVAIPGQGLVAS